MDEVKKPPLILFSGGLDSTYLLWQRLQTTNVEVLYIRGPQGEDKTEMEDKARERIREWLCTKGKTPYSILKTYDVEMPHGDQSQDNTFSQLLPWFYAALNKSTGYRHSCVEMAYVMGDQISYFLNDIARAWDTLAWAIKGAPVELKFPLIMKHKHAMIKEMPTELYNLIWYCELPENKEACGKCPACYTHRNALFIHDNTIAIEQAKLREREEIEARWHEINENATVIDQPVVSEQAASEIA